MCRGGLVDRRQGAAVGGLIAIAMALGFQAAPSTWQSVQANGPTPGTITTIAGASLNSGPATTYTQQPWGVATFGSTLYLSDQSGNVVRAVGINTGHETVVAGNGTVGTFGDGGPATVASLNGPRGLAVDSSGNLYIATSDRVRMVNPSGTITLVAGGLSSASGVAVDAAGDVFIADTGNNRILRVDHTTTVVTPFAGTGAPGFSGDTGPATSAQLWGPQGITVDSAGTTVWIADTMNQRIRKVAGGTIDTVAGNPTNTPGCTTGASALTTTLILPTGVWVDGSGNVFIADTNNMCIRELSGTTLTTVAGTGTIGYSGDAGPATSAKLADPTGVTTDGSGNMFIADNYTYRVRKVTSGGIITTIAGTGFLPPSVCTLNGDGDQATAILLCDVSGIALDTSGDTFFSDILMNVVRKVTPAGVITTVAGTGAQGHSGDNGPATAAQLNSPGALAIDSNGDLLIAERSYPSTIRRVDSLGVIHTVAGGGSNQAGTGPVPATSVALSFPSSIAVMPNGDFFIADTGFNTVERVSGGNIARIAGGGPNFPGDGGPATLATLYSPSGVAVDSSGNLYITSPGGNRLHKVDLSGIITTAAVFSPYGPGAVAIAPSGQVVVTTYFSQLVALTPDGQLPIAGNGGAFSGDGGPAYLAGMSPGAFTFDSAGNIFVADGGNKRVRRIQAFAAPAAPTSVSADPNIHSATVHWSAPAATGGLPIARYTVRSYQGATPGPSVVATATPAIVGGLAANLPYTFTVTAFNGWETGPASTSSPPVTPSVLVSNGEIRTYAGSMGSGPALTLGQFPYSLALVGTHLYVGDFGNPVIRDVDLTSGQEGVLAGNDAYGYRGDGGPSAAAMIQGAGAMAYCGGQIYFADTFNFVIRKIDPSGKITTVAGVGQYGYGGDGGPATSAVLGRVFGLACRTGGGLYVSDSDNGAVRIIDAAGTITTWWSGFDFPTGIVERGGQNLVTVSDSDPDNAVWNLTNKVATLVAGYPGLPGYSGDGGPAGSLNSQLNDPRGLAYVGGSLYIADRSNNAIRVVNPQGIISTAFVPDGPTGLVADAAHNLLYVANFGSMTVWRADLTINYATTIAGNGTPSRSGDGGPAAQAQLGYPYAVAADSAGNVLIADNLNEVIRRVGPTGIITTVAGSGVAGYSGDGGPATAAELNDPRGVAVAPNGDIYISDTSNHRIRVVDHKTGLITTVVSGLDFPRAVAVDAIGNLYIANTEANEVLEVNSAGTVITFAGTGAAGYSGDGGPATSSKLNNPRGLAVDSAQNVYIGDSDNNRVRRVDHATGIITTVAGNGTAGFAGDGAAATLAKINAPFGLAVDGAGNLYIADVANNRIRVVDTNGHITSVIGICSGIPGFSGDGGPASIAQTDFPFGLAIDGFDDVFIADPNSNRVRVATGLIGVRNASCQGPAGTPGDRGTTQSGSSTPALLIADPAGTHPRFAPDAWVPSGHASRLPVQPRRVPAKPPSTKAAPPATIPGATRGAPAAPAAPVAGPEPARGQTPYEALPAHAQASRLPWAATLSLLLVTAVALMALVVTVLRRRRQRRMR